MIPVSSRPALLYKGFQASQGGIVKPCLRNKQTITKNKLTGHKDSGINKDSQFTILLVQITAFPHRVIITESNSVTSIWIELYQMEYFPKQWHKEKKAHIPLFKCTSMLPRLLQRKVALLNSTGWVISRPLYQWGFPFPHCSPQSAFLQCKGKKANVKKKAHFTALGILIESLENVPLKGDPEPRTNCGLQLHQMMPVPISTNNQKPSNLDRQDWQGRRLKTLSLSQYLEVSRALPLPAPTHSEYRLSSPCFLPYYSLQTQRSIW